MIFHKTKLLGVVAIELEFNRDEHGFFARSSCQQEFEKQGLNPKIVQCSTSFNARKGTLRGMHYQAAPYGETKLVRCTMGAIYDEIIDLRTDSPTFRKGIGFTLTAENRGMAYIPQGCAHGFLTLKDESEVFYQMSEFHRP